MTLIHLFELTGIEDLKGHILDIIPMQTRLYLHKIRKVSQREDIVHTTLPRSLPYYGASSHKDVISGWSRIRLLPPTSISSVGE